MNKRRFLIPIIALAAALVLATIVLADLTPGTKAPSFTLPTLDGKSFTLANEFKRPGNVVILDIWATWCPPCRAEIPHLVTLSNQFKGKPVKIVGVAIDAEKSKVVSFAKDNKINYTIALDPNADKVAGPYKVRGIPATYIIDKTGVIRYAHVGFSGEAQAKKMQDEVNTLLKK